MKYKITEGELLDNLTSSNNYEKVDSIAKFDQISKMIGGGVLRDLLNFIDQVLVEENDLIVKVLAENLHFLFHKSPPGESELIIESIIFKILQNENIRNKEILVALNKN